MTLCVRAAAAGTFLKPLPFITWHIYNGGVDVNGTFTKFFGDTHAAFMPEPSSTWAQMLVGGESIQENEMTPATPKRGLNFWPQYIREPSRVEIVVLRIPKAMAFGTVVF